MIPSNHRERHPGNRGGGAPRRPQAGRGHTRAGLIGTTALAGPGLPRDFAYGGGGGGFMKFALPVALAVIGTLVAPGIGTALGSTLSSTTLGSIGAAAGAGIGTKATGGSWGQALLSAGGSFLGGQLLGPAATGAEGAAGTALEKGAEQAAMQGAEQATLHGMKEAATGAIVDSVTGEVISQGMTQAGQQALNTAGQQAATSILDTTIGQSIQSALGSELPGALGRAAASTTWGNAVGSFAGSKIGESVGGMIDPPKIEGEGFVNPIAQGMAAQSSIPSAWMPGFNGPLVNSSSEDEKKSEQQRQTWGTTQIGYTQPVAPGVSYSMPVVNRDSGQTEFRSNFSPISYGNQETRNRRNTWANLIAF